eukprot:g2483.t1
MLSTLDHHEASKKELSQSSKLDYGPIVDDLRRNFNSGLTRPLEFRKKQLRQIKLLLEENHEAITAAVLRDHNQGAKIRGLVGEVLQPHKHATQVLAHLDSWAAPEKVQNDNWLGSALVRREPKGVVLLISPWNYPVCLVFDPLVSIIASGNCCLIKPSEVSSNCAVLIEELVRKYLDPRVVRVVQGAIPETTALLRERYDHILYTGNGHVGKIVYNAAAKHLTPVTLELGGKSPVIIDKTAKMSAVINRIFLAKWLNCGQTCIAPDYVLVDESREEEFLEALVAYIKEKMGKTAAERRSNQENPRIINSRHTQRVNRLLSTTKGKVYGDVGGSSEVDIDKCYMQMTILSRPSLEDEVMKEEVFGPLLPVIPVKNVDEAISTIKKVCDHPLALYIFSEDSNTVERILNSTVSGGVCVNSVMEQISNMNLPFGGIGASGSGSYHGKFGFDEFSHKRSVVYKDTTFTSAAALPPPPYGDALYNLAVKMTLTGFLSPWQKRSLYAALLALAVGLGHKQLTSML